MKGLVVAHRKTEKKEIFVNYIIPFFSKTKLSTARLTPIFSRNRK